MASQSSLYGFDPLREFDLQLWRRNWNSQIPQISQRNKLLRSTSASLCDIALKKLATQKNLNKISINLVIKKTWGCPR